MAYKRRGDGDRVDTDDIIKKAQIIDRAGGETYIAGTGESLPFENDTADLMIYLASFHHIPDHEMTRALTTCYRILKPGGAAVFIEPVARPGSYYELIRLAEDEASIQAKAYDQLKQAEHIGFRWKAETFYYLERSFDDYVTLIETTYADPQMKKVVLGKARAKVKKACKDAGVSLDQYRYRSICRINILDK